MEFPELAPTAPHFIGDVELLPTGFVSPILVVPEVSGIRRQSARLWAGCMLTTSVRLPKAGRANCGGR